MLQPASADWSPAEAAHLLRRAGFGGSPTDLERFHALGRERAIDSLFITTDPAGAFPLPAWAEPEQALADQRERALAIRDARQAGARMTPEEADRLRRETQQKYQREARRQTVEAQGWWFDRMLATQAPLREKMVLFWHDHFASSIQKVRQPVPMVRQNELFRSHALGSFKDLTGAIVRDPAMMLYLDTQNSKKGQPNENFARELMELFTLGEGHYTEQDIKEAARALTGYQLNRMTGRVLHNRRQWDSGDKTIFGRTGRFDGDDVVSILFEQPAAARYVPRKLWEYFVAEAPSDATVEALAQVFTEGGFKVEPLLRTIFRSQEFYDAAVIRGQIKGPIQYLLQLLKELELDRAPAAYVLNAEQQLGQVLFAPPNVAGWDWGKAWINTNTLLTRYNIAGFITKGSQDGPAPDAADRATMAEMAGGGGGAAKGDRQMMVRAKAMEAAGRRWQGPDYEKITPRPLREDPAKLVEALMARFFQSPLTGRQQETFVEYATAKKGAIFTNHEVAELCHLMLSTPYYQLA